MEYFASNEFGTTFYTLGATVTVWILWLGYYRNRFSTPLARTVSVAIVGFTIFYLTYRFGSGYTPEQMSTHAGEAFYGLRVGAHAFLSTWAIAQTCTVLIRAERPFREGRNYFREHPALTLSLAVLWPLSLALGFFLG